MARRTNDVPKFRRKQKVVAARDLPGVPEGTAGVIYYEAGLTWFRYHVAFANGLELANVDGNALVTADEWKKQALEARRAQLLAERDARQAEALATVHRQTSH